ncbi:hypothetical protein AWE51_00170 [Aquimarina aggregata]|uniref:Uncharacterized protein n=1 Tax=Aquimarina aggregata TaxID=1642818 RepID=A0A163BYB5_9FLAO|nr:hypothetical protein [Aquimarina aggregata]KZS41896.1 hypothetical protein AWE51_00170 [Aquimarina aggregata]
MGNISVELVGDALKKHTVINKDVAKADFARATSVTLDKFCKKVTKIKGSYHVLHSIMTHVVQGFKAEWKELGAFAAKSKELKNYRQKVNFGFVPDDVMSSFLAEWYEEDKKPTDKMIAKKITEWLLTQVQDDLENLSIGGIYDADAAHGAFGYSLNGLEQIVKNALADAENPVFKIPLNVFTDDNIIDEMRKFERGLPKGMKNKFKVIHTSLNNLERYETAYFDRFGHHPSFKDSDKTKSPLKKREIVGHEGLSDDIMFATLDGNILNLIDVIDNPPKFTDVQVLDYKVKMFMEFWKGYDFLINQAVCVANFTSAVRGLGDEDQMKLYFPREQKITAPPVTP